MFIHDRKESFASLTNDGPTGDFKTDPQKKLNAKVQPMRRKAYTIRNMAVYIMREFPQPGRISLC